LAYAKTFLKRFTVKAQAEAGFSVGKESLPFFNFIFGGYGFNTLNNFKHFYGYDFLSISADSYIKTTITFDYEFIKKNHVNLAANYANIEDHLFDTTKWISSPKYSGYALGYGLETIAGPIEIKYSWSPELGKGFAWFSVGFWF
jgi:NTE family protein